MKKIFLILAMLLALFLAISSVSASEGAADVLADADAQPILEETLNDDAVSENAENEVSSEAQDADAISAGEAQNASPVATAEAQDVNAISAGESQVVAAQDNNVVSESETAKKSSSVSASKTIGYKSFKTKFIVDLTVAGKKAPGKTIKLKINGKQYYTKTNSNGKAVFYLSLAKGVYKAKFSYAGDSKTEGSYGSAKIIVNNPKKTRFIVCDRDINYRQGSKCLFGVRLLDNQGKAVSHQKVKIKVGGKIFKIKTTKKGYANIFVSLKKGKQKFKFTYYAKSPYLGAYGSFKVKVRPPMAKGNGYWLWSDDMNRVDLNDLANKGTKHLFLHVHSISVHGRNSVVSFIERANDRGINVHMWMQVCYGEGGWVSLVRDDGSFKHSFINSKVEEAKYYARLPGVAGVHMDYVRYGGTAYKHINAAESINYLVKKVSLGVHSVRPNCIVSVAIMPEPDAMYRVDGQDVPTISKYADMLLPMVYKGNYQQDRAWIKSVTKTFVKQSNGAQIWTGLQAYASDDNPTLLSEAQLLKDARSAMYGGARGVVLFRIGYSKILNFNRV